MEVQLALPEVAFESGHKLTAKDAAEHLDGQEEKVARVDPIRCPVLVLQGAQDEYGTAKQVEAIQTKIPWTLAVILEDCRRAPHRDQREATLSAISRFLPTLPSFADSITDGEG